VEPSYSVELEIPSNVLLLKGDIIHLSSEVKFGTEKHTAWPIGRAPKYTAWRDNFHLISAGNGRYAACQYCNGSALFTISRLISHEQLLRVTAC